KNVGGKLLYSLSFGAARPCAAFVGQRCNFLLQPPNPFSALLGVCGALPRTPQRFARKRIMRPFEKGLT
ncbi:MAG: hypothetical protein ACI4J8_08720, partial [Oscillospiraceae bacterium]